LGVRTLARLVTASDVGVATVEQAVDDLAVAYTATPPPALLARTRAHLGYVTGLLERRCTLAERTRMAHLRTAVQIARETSHGEIAAWSLETRAWQLLITGDYPAAVRLAQAAQRSAPTGSSVLIQATAQEGRAFARLGAAPETRDALGAPRPWCPRCRSLTSPSTTTSTTRPRPTAT
jgi:hypothetical protein